MTWLVALTLTAAMAPAQTDLRQLDAIAIVEQASPFEQQAANVLQKHLATMLGTRLPIVTGGEGRLRVGRAAASMIGDVDLASLNSDGLVVRVRDGRVAIAGKNDWGAIFAAYTWLEQLGYRYYAPELEVTPKLDNPLIADGDVVSEPTFVFRRGAGWQLRGTPQELIGDVRIAGKELGLKLWIDHTAGYLIPRPTYLESHPEYFPLRHDGTRGVTRDSDGYVHLCLSNPDVIRITTERAVAWIDSQSDRRFFPITQGDGHDWCQCTNCLAMDSVPGVYSDRLLKWVNHIARAAKVKHPDVRIVCLAYVGSDEPPLRERPESNVMVLYCPYWGVNLSMAHTLTHEFNTEAFAQFTGWQKVADGQLGVYDYNTGYCPSWFAMAEKLKWYADENVQGIFLLGAPRPFNRMFSYVIGRMMWDTSLDAETLMREFVTAYYGEAAPYLMQYLQAVNARLAQGYPRGLHDGDVLPAGFYDPPYGDRMLALLDDAVAAVEGNQTLAARVGKERDLFLADRKTAMAVRDKPEPDGAAVVTTERVVVPPSAFRGGYYAPGYNWFCPPRDAVAVYAPRSPRSSKAVATFDLPSAPTGSVRMIVDGQDSQNDLPPVAQIELRLNDVVIHRGDCGFIKQGWSTRTFDIPAGALKAGRNTLTFSNINEATKRLDGWWCMLAGVTIELEAQP